jgi:hypothetical protein
MKTTGPENSESHQTGPFQKGISALSTRKNTELVAPLPSEAKAIADAQERMARRRPRIEASVKSEDRSMKIRAPHSDTTGFVTQLYDCFGTGSAAFAEQAIARLAAIISGSGSASPTQTELNGCSRPSMG